eukprot:4828028-Pleurochrysis_carterae.AAC.1
MRADGPTVRLYWLVHLVHSHEPSSSLARLGAAAVERAHRRRAFEDAGEAHLNFVVYLYCAVRLMLTMMHRTK